MSQITLSDRNMRSSLKKFSRVSKPQILGARYAELQRLFDLFGKSDKGIQVLYFGDSVIERTAHEDIDKRSLGQMLVDELTGKVKSVYLSHSAYHSQIYYYLVLALTQQMTMRPQLVILPVNLRSFSPQWDLNPDWQFEEEIKAIQKFLLNPVAIPRLRKHYHKKHRYQIFDQTTVYYPYSTITQIGEFRRLISSNPSTFQEEAMRQREIFNFHYMTPLSIRHPKVKYLQLAVEQLISVGIKVICYSTPVNYKLGERLVGERATVLLRENVDVIRRATHFYQQNNGLQFWNYTFLLDSVYFFHPDLLTEHLNQYGRREIASRISQLILGSCNS
ncbi:MAG: hypothetical protein HY862_04665 [Chloroflexi bacterium]|nr:hypothetical protein [Chloroflexota bacterium]